MMNFKNPAEIYNIRLSELTILLSRLNKKKNQFAWLRFASVAAAFLAAYLLWEYGLFISIGSFILFFAAFLRIVVLDVKNKNNIENTNTLIDINREEIKIGKHEFTHRD